eukprot:Clim_evm36s157 gene=Clim_evmTU36s157
MFKDSMPSTAQSKSLDLPVLSLREAQYPNGSKERKLFLAQLQQACSETGFFYLTDFGYTTSELDNLLHHVRKFFAMPEDKKEALWNGYSPHFRGYTKLGGEKTNSVADQREQLDIGPEREAKITPEQKKTADNGDYWVMQGPNMWPDEPDCPEFKQSMMDFAECMDHAARVIMKAIAENLGLDYESKIAPLTRGNHWFMKAIRYPKPKEVPPNHFGVGAHRDYSLLSFVLQDDIGGLQARPEGSPEYEDVQPMKGGLVTAIGEMLEVVTGGRYLATIHRVLVSPTMSEDRYSLAYFHNPALDAIVEEKSPGNGQGSTRKVDTDTDAEGETVARTFVAGSNAHLEYGKAVLQGFSRSHQHVVKRHWPALQDKWIPQ